jgi:flagellar FliJ protein
MSSLLDDRALQAVRRVRSFRERDSRIGLQRALAAQREREAETETARQRLVAESTFDTGAADAFRAHRLLAAALAERHADKLRLTASSATVAAEAQRHWQRQRSGIRAVELLLDRRAAERRAERARQETRELDDIAGQAWQRRQTAPSEGGRP